MRGFFPIRRSVDDLFSAVDAVPAGEKFWIARLACLRIYPHSTVFQFEVLNVKEETFFGRLTDGRNNHVDGKLKLGVGDYIRQSFSITIWNARFHSNAF